MNLLLKADLPLLLPVASSEDIVFLVSSGN